MSSENPHPADELVARQEELADQFDSAMDLCEELKRAVIDNVRAGNLLEALKIMRKDADAIRKAAKFSADSEWVEALLRSEIPHADILKIWEIRDQVSREVDEKVRDLLSEQGK